MVNLNKVERLTPSGSNNVGNAEEEMEMGKKRDGELRKELEKILAQEEALTKNENNKDYFNGFPGPAIRTVVRGWGRQRMRMEERKKEIENLLAGKIPYDAHEARIRANPETQKEEVRKLINERGRKEREEMGPAYGPNYDSGTGGKRRPGGWSEISSNR